MLKRTTSLYAIAILALCGFFALPTSAKVIEHDGWLYGEEAAKAIEKAEEYGVPIAMMHTFRDTTCPKCVNAAQVMASVSSHKKIVRVMVYFGKGSDGLNASKTMDLFRKVQRQVKRKSNYIPDLYYTMADGTPLGFVDYQEAAKAREQGANVLKIGQWLSGANKDIEKADRDAERGRFAQALASIDKIIEQDAQVSHLVQIQLNKAKKEDKAPETPVSPFFSTLRAEKFAAYQELAQKELAKAQKLVDEGELREAQRAARTLMRGPEDFATTAAAEKLHDEIVEKLRSASK